MAPCIREHYSGVLYQGGTALSENDVQNGNAPLKDEDNRKTLHK
jgi:hypothetical protein